MSNTMYCSDISIEQCGHTNPILPDKMSPFLYQISWLSYVPSAISLAFGPSQFPQPAAASMYDVIDWKHKTSEFIYEKHDVVMVYDLWLRKTSKSWDIDETGWIERR